MKIRFLFALLAFAYAPLLKASEPLRVTVEAPNGDGPTLIWDQKDKTSHFHVLVTNISDVPQRIWQDWNSWGWFNLRFEFVEAGRRVIRAAKTGHVWSGNAPICWTLAPHEVHVFDVYFADPEKGWDGFPPLEKTERKYFTITAIYETGESAESKAQRVWTGKIASEPLNVLLVDPH